MWVLKISNIENYLNSEINQRKLCSKKVSKHVATLITYTSFLIVFSATSGEVCIISSVSVAGAPIGIVRKVLL